MVLRFSPPIAFSDACRTARASCAEALPASPITTTTIKNLFTVTPPRRLAVWHGPIIPATLDHEGATRAKHKATRILRRFAMTMMKWACLGLLSALAACSSAQAPGSNGTTQTATDPRADGAENVRLVGYNDMQ